MQNQGGYFYNGIGGNLYEDQRVNLEFFLIAEVGTCLGVTLIYFYTNIGG